MEFVYKQFIDGQWVGANSGGSWEVIDPASGNVVATVPFGDRSDAKDAIVAAKKVHAEWAAKTPYERGEILTRAACLIEDRLDMLAPTMTRETGKPLSEARGEWQVCAHLLSWYAEEGKRAYGRIIPSRNSNKRMMVILQPVGVVATITGWNFPAYLPCRAWAAALAAGCTVVGKPSELTPLSAMSLAGILEKAGIPAGAFNLVNGNPEGMGQEMLENCECHKISFTGSTRVGRKLMEGAGQNITKLSLELGGNAPVIVFSDADVNRVAKEVVTYKFRNCGQVCNSPTRFYVHEGIEEEFLTAVVAETRNLIVGPGMDPQVHVGPLINAKQLGRVEAMVEDAQENGAELLAGGHRLKKGKLSKGYFFEPTVLAKTNARMQVMVEEVFGPILPVMSFNNLDEAIELANSTKYGLAGYVWTNDIDKAVMVSERLECGMVGINTIAASAVEAPFGGYKESGIGRECGSEGLLNYMQSKLITLSLTS